MTYEDLEMRHSAWVRKNSSECTLLLKKDGSFPLSAPCKLALYGSGSRNTIKGGTGSGDVNSRYSVSIEQGLRDAGFTITSECWLDAYDQEKKDAKERFVKKLKQEAEEKKMQAVMLAVGQSVPEPEYNIPIDAEGDTCVYVLSRISGEGSDRKEEKGDIFLSDTEIRDILTCNQRYQNFLLVLNVGGPVDLSPVLEVSNIMLLSQLGAETGNIFADLLLGRTVPSGKLSTTWSAWDDYCKEGDFGEKNETRYKEGIYVGYRYFDKAGIRPLFPFGFGLSYTDFRLGEPGMLLDGDLVTVTLPVTNVGTMPGKEAVQIYVSLPEGKLDEPIRILAGFAKSALLQPGETEDVRVSFRLRELAPYDTNRAMHLLEKGTYFVFAGNEDNETSLLPAGSILVENEMPVRILKNRLGVTDFTDMNFTVTPRESFGEAPVFTLSEGCIQPETVNYERCPEIDSDIKNLSDEKLVKMNIGAFSPKADTANMIGNSGFSVAGSAGETCLEVKEDGIESVVMVDGPAGIRVARQYVKDETGVHTIGLEVPEFLLDFLPETAVSFLKSNSCKAEKGQKVYEQNATAIPIGTAVAQSFNVDFAQACGSLVGEEMERFGVQLWLAPALNIHRDIRCGRNFEYYSEDPLLSGKIAAAITRGVQAYPSCGVTIKHFAANNQEYNRTHNNSMVSERALREIYLKGFEICIREIQPHALMTSYNLLNGVHTSESGELVEDVLRSEWGYQGLVMTDWTVADMDQGNDCKYPAAAEPAIAQSGVDILMPGGNNDYRLLMEALENGIVSRTRLEESATRVARLASLLKVGK